MTSITAPMPSRFWSKFYAYKYGPQYDYSPEEKWEGTSRVIRIPCWDDTVACYPGRVSLNGLPWTNDNDVEVEQNITKAMDMFPCDFYSGPNVSLSDVSYYHGVYAAALQPGNDLAKAADRFQY